MRKLVILIAGCIILTGCIANKVSDTIPVPEIVQPVLPAPLVTAPYVDPLPKVENLVAETASNPYLAPAPMGHIPEAQSNAPFTGWAIGGYGYYPVYTQPVQPVPQVIIIWQGQAIIIKQ